ncbi:amidohydrolase family protein [Clostridium sp. DJ247]|uniref:amidohydrolase family protein n=1 Tax=Clostridium sp. DJ247 TaxID=2726188 RepID=UPI001623776F|nr:amidohydrolase family protein [Clostridium sp. DJ247]MBC2582258.1 amidohydrolase family protein [Clostridium sp. DJ247]
MIIDGHAHATGDFLKANNIIKILDENNVDYVVLAGSLQISCEKNQDLSYFSKFIEKYPLKFIYILNNIIKLVNFLNKSSTKIDLGNEYAYNLVKQHTDRMIQFYWVNPCEKDIINKIDVNYKKYKFKGIKLHQCITKFDLREGYMHEISEWAGQKGMPIFIHLCTKKDAFDMVELIRKHKNTKFIIAHLIGLEVFIDAKIDASNVFFDISCPQIVTKNKIVLAIEKFGAERIIMGSDTPYGRDNLRNAIYRIQELELSDLQKELILGKNIQQLLKI